MNELIPHGTVARADWAGHQAAFEEPDPRYRNRPDCDVGAAIKDEDLRQGSYYRPRGDRYRNSQKSGGHTE